MKKVTNLKNSETNMYHVDSELAPTTFFCGIDLKLVSSDEMYEIPTL